MRRTSIAHVLTSLELGGAEAVALTLATRQARRGDRVAVLALCAPVDRALHKAFVDAGVETAVVTKARDTRLPWTMRLIAWLRAGRFDVVHTHNELALVRVAPLARLMGARVVHTKHGPHPASGLETIARRLSSLALRRFAAVSSDTARAALAQGETSRPKLRLVENGIELAPFKPSTALRARTRDELNLAKSTRVFGTVGRLAPVKNHLGILRALAPHLSADRKWLVIGHGSEREAIDASARALGVSQHVLMLGHQVDVPKWYQAMDVFVMASHAEGLPLAMIEAMASGVPIVSYAVGGIASAFGSAIQLVSYGDEATLGRAAIRIAMSESVSAELSRRGLTLVNANHDAESMTTKYDELYGNAERRSDGARSTSYDANMARTPRSRP